MAAARVFPMTDGSTEIEHLVTDRAAQSGRVTGVYFGACGVQVVPGSLLTSPRQQCTGCRQRMAGAL